MDFIEQLASYVQKYAPLYGIKVYSPIIAQGILESDKGNSELAVNAHNYFGLKYRPNRCPSSNGTYIKVGSEQDSNGQYISSSMTWCKFPDMESCVKGYFDFINIPNYSNLKGVTDYKTYIELLKQDGYATSHRYVENIIRVIESYGLTKYDEVNEMSNAKKVRIAIDTGHGSNTAGKRTPDGYREHWINVKTAYYLEYVLNQLGIETVRIAWNDTNATDDIDVPLSTRQNQIKQAGCDYSVSLHANAFGDGKSYNSAEGVSTHIHNNSAYLKDSLRLAQCIQRNITQGTKQRDRGVVRQSLAMCNCKTMNTKASCLVEIAFMTNKREADLMKTDAFCKEQAVDIARGIIEYLNIVEDIKIPLTNTNTNDTIKESKTDNTKVESAKSHSSDVQGFYKVSSDDTGLNLRTGAGANKSLIGTLRNNETVTCHGYYTLVGNTKWLLVSTRLGTGFCSSKYLRKQ